MWRKCLKFVPYLIFFSIAISIMLINFSLASTEEERERLEALKNEIPYYYYRTVQAWQNHEATQSSEDEALMKAYYRYWASAKMEYYSILAGLNFPETLTAEYKDIISRYALSSLQILGQWELENCGVGFCGDGNLDCIINNIDAWICFSLFGSTEYCALATFDAICNGRLDSKDIITWMHPPYFFHGCPSDITEQQCEENHLLSPPTSDDLAGRFVINGIDLVKLSDSPFYPIAVGINTDMTVQEVICDYATRMPAISIDSANGMLRELGLTPSNFGHVTDIYAASLDEIYLTGFYWWYDAAGQANMQSYFLRLESGSPSHSSYFVRYVTWAEPYTVWVTISVDREKTGELYEDFGEPCWPTIEQICKGYPNPYTLENFAIAANMWLKDVNWCE